MKSVKNLLVPFIILIALIIGVVIYFAVSNAKNKAPEESSYGVTTVVYFNASDINSLSVLNRDTGFTSRVKCSTNSNGTVVYEYQGDDLSTAETYSQSALLSYVEYLTSFSYYVKVSTGGNLAEYGLDNPAFTITIVPKTGNTTTIYLGNKSPDVDYCYMYVEGSTDVYTVAVNKLVQAEKTGINFLETKALNIDYADVETVHFDRKTDGLSLDANVTLGSYNIPVFDFYKPYKHAASVYFANMIDSVTKLEISEYVAIDKSELSKYGLDDPTFHFVISMKDGKKTELFFSKKINGFYYGYMTGLDKYFMLSEYQLDGIEMQELVLIDPYVCYYYVQDLSSITCTYLDSSFKLELDVPEGEPITSQRSFVYVDGRSATVTTSKGRSYAAILYESIACINIGGIEPDANVNTAKEPEISLVFVDNNYNTITYDFYVRDDSSYYVYKDGEFTSFYVYSREFFNYGGADTYNYGVWSAYELLDEAITKNINGVYDLPA